MRSKQTWLLEPLRNSSSCSFSTKKTRIYTLNFDLSAALPCSSKKQRRSFSSRWQIADREARRIVFSDEDNVAGLLLRLHHIHDLSVRLIMITFDFKLLRIAG